MAHAMRPTPRGVVWAGPKEFVGYWDYEQLVKILPQILPHLTYMWILLRTISHIFHRLVLKAVKVPVLAKQMVICKTCKQNYNQTQT